MIFKPDQLLSPIAEVTLDGEDVRGAVDGLRIISRRRVPVALAEVETGLLTDAERSLFVTGAVLKVAMGYRGLGVWPVFQGRLVEPREGQRKTHLAKDDFAKVLESRFTREFLEIGAADVLRTMLAPLGVSVGSLRVPGKALPRLTLNRETVGQAINKLEGTFGTWAGVDTSDWSHGLDQRTQAFSWGAWEAPNADDVTVLDSGNLVRFELGTAGRSEVETVALPWVHPGDLVRVVAPAQGVDRRFRVEDVERIFRRRSSRHKWILGEVPA